MSQSHTERSDARSESVEMTVGDLVAAITEIAWHAGKTEQEGYSLARKAVEQILRKQRLKELRESGGVSALRRRRRRSSMVVL